MGYSWDAQEIINCLHELRHQELPFTFKNIVRQMSAEDYLPTFLGVLQTTLTEGAIRYEDGYFFINES